MEYVALINVTIGRKQWVAGEEFEEEEAVAADALAKGFIEAKTQAPIPASEPTVAEHTPKDGKKGAKR